MTLHIDRTREQARTLAAMLLVLPALTCAQGTRVPTGASPRSTANPPAPEAAPGTSTAHSPGMMVRISEIEVDPDRVDEYNAILATEAAASVRLEPGVIAIFPMFQRDHPSEIRILEIYASRAAYESHIKSPHFEHYKTATLPMVRSLKLVDMVPMDTATMTTIFGKMR